MRQRQIKFRAQDIASNKWLYGDLRHHKDDVCIFEQGGTKGEQVKHDTIGQFVGLKDKNGKEIYEGDIMYSEFSDGSGGYSLIGWNEREASFGMMDAYSYQSKQEGYDFPEFKNYVLIAHLQKALICEVVGNIYDNPELLTKTK